MAIDPFEAEARFHELAARDGDSLGLAEGALLIAAMEAPGVDPQACLDEIDALADEARPRVDRAAGLASRLDSLGAFLGLTVGFCGNEEAYGDLDNSLLHRVLERRTGIPVTLSVVWIEVGRRAGLPLVGVGMPLHFLVGVEGGHDLYADPFGRGRILERQDCARILLERSGGEMRLEPRMLTPIPDRRILLRILVNLRGASFEREDVDGALRATSAMVALEPEVPELYRDRGVLALKLGDGASAEADLGRYLEMRPDARDAELMRHVLHQAGDTRLTVN